MKVYTWIIETGTGKRAVFTGTEEEARSWAKVHLGATFTMYRRA